MVPNILFTEYYSVSGEVARALRDDYGAGDTALASSNFGQLILSSWWYQLS